MLDLRLIALSFAVNVAGKRNVRRWLRAADGGEWPSAATDHSSQPVDADVPRLLYVHLTRQS